MTIEGYYYIVMTFAGKGIWKRIPFCGQRVFNGIVYYFNLLPASFKRLTYVSRKRPLVSGGTSSR